MIEDATLVLNEDADDNPSLIDVAPSRAPEPDDIPDPMTPVGVLSVEDELRAAMFLMKERYKQTLEHLDTTFVTIKDLMDGMGKCNEQATVKLADALEMLTMRGLKTQALNELTLTMRTPQGIPVALTLRREEGKVLLETLEATIAYFLERGYTA